MIMIIKILLLIIFTIIPTYALAGWFGPSNSEECIQSYVAKTNSEGAAKLVTHACRQMFEEPNFESYWNDMVIANTDQISRKTIYEEIARRKNQTSKEAKDQAYSDYLKKIEKEKNHAKCVINLNNLYEAKNSVAAKAIYQTSSCIKLKGQDN